MKDGFTTRTHFTIHKKPKDDSKTLFQNSSNNVGQCREQKNSVEKIFLPKLASKDGFTHPNSVKHMMSKFGHSQKSVLKTMKHSSSNAGKLVTEKDVLWQKTHGKGFLHS